MQFNEEKNSFPTLVRQACKLNLNASGRFEVGIRSVLRKTIEHKKRISTIRIVTTVALVLKTRWLFRLCFHRNSALKLN